MISNMYNQDELRGQVDDALPEPSSEWEWESEEVQTLLANEMVGLEEATVERLAAAIKRLRRRPRGRSSAREAVKMLTGREARVSERTKVVSTFVAQQAADDEEVAQ